MFHGGYYCSLCAVRISVFVMLYITNLFTSEPTFVNNRILTKDTLAGTFPPNLIGPTLVGINDYPRALLG